MIIHSAAPRILDFDLECRPLSWYGGDWVTRDITAIGWKWLGEKKVHSYVMEHYLDQENMLDAFLAEYEKADIVTGHFIRAFDLPVINAALIEHGRHPLEGRMSSDTKLDMVKRSGMSTSQENLAAIFGLKNPKVSMDQAKWREANRLTPKGLALTKKRVEGDVVQHEEMRNHMLELGLLTPPRWWSPEGVGYGKYHA